MEKQSNGVQSLEVGLSVLNVLIEAGEALMLKDVAAAADMHPAKAHRYLVSLVKYHYAKQQEDGRYSLGDKALAMGLGLPSGMAGECRYLRNACWRSGYLPFGYSSSARYCS